MRIFLFILISIITFINNGRAQPTATLSFPTLNAMPGFIEVPMTIEEINAAIAGGEWFTQFNPAHLNFTGVSFTHPNFPDSEWVYSNNTGEINLTWWPSDYIPENVSPGESLLTLHFEWNGECTDIIWGEETSMLSPDGPFELTLIDGSVCPVDLLPPQNLTAIYQEPHSIFVSWDPPSPPFFEEWIQWDSGENHDFLGAGLSPIWCASHWDTSYLGDYHNYYLSKISFVPGMDTSCSYAIKVWTGQDGQTEIYSQRIENFTPGEWNEIILFDPVLINANEDLWFGYAVNPVAGAYPCGVDEGPAIAGCGDMVCFDGMNWQSMSINFGMDVNWNIAGFITNMPFNKKELLAYNLYKNDEILLQTTDTEYLDTVLNGYEFCYFATAIYNEGESLPSNEACVWTTPPLSPPENLMVEFLEPDDLFLSWDAPSRDSLTLLGYNIYKNNTFLTFHEEETYLDENVCPGNYCFVVTAVYEEGESAPSNEACAEATPIECFPFNDSFDEYNIEEALACQSCCWTTWNNIPCSMEDPFLTDEENFSSPYAVKIVSGNDLLQWVNNYEEGHFTISFNIFIPENKTGYFFGLLQYFPEYPSSSVWGMQVFFNNDGSAQIETNHAWDIFSYQQDIWQKLIFSIDIEEDWLQFFLNDELIHESQWSYCPFKEPINSFAGIGFYPYPQETAAFYIDNYSVDFYSADQLHPFDNRITLFPNPASESIFITSEFILKKVNIFDYSGCSVINQSLLGSFNATLLVKDLDPGIYFVQIETSNRTSTHKVIIQ